MKGSPCCAGLMRSCLHTYRTKTNLTQHIIQPWGGYQPSMGGAISQVWGVINQLWGGVINRLWGGPSAKYGGGHQPTMGGYFPTSTNYGGGHQPSMGGVCSHQYQLWGGPSAKYGGGHQPTMGGAISQVWGGGIFPPVCTGSQTRENYFSNTYVLPAGPMNNCANQNAAPRYLSYCSYDSTIHQQYSVSTRIFIGVLVMNLTSFVTILELES